MTSQGLLAVLHAIAAEIDKEKDFLTQLDNVIGDGDHGINLARGFRAVEPKLDAVTDTSPAGLLKAVGMTLVSTVGGASGALYGTAFMRMGAAVAGKETIGMAEFLTALQAGIEGICTRGRSHEGEKTMLDAMIPAKKAMQEAMEAGKTDREIFAAGIAAAEAGIEFTKTIAATKGRASYLGERSIGHQDPGATSFTAMLKVVGERIG